MRALPASVFSGYPDDVTVDASFVAERLGLSEGALRQAMRVGRVTAVVEHGEGDDAGRVRVSFRDYHRCWSGVIEPDGRAYELDQGAHPSLNRIQHRSPRPGLRREMVLSETALTLNTLRLLVRSVLLRRVAKAGELTEGELLGCIDGVMPSVDLPLLRRALAILMHEDERSGRPFLAALVKSDADDEAWDGFMVAARRCRPGGQRCPVDDDGGRFWRAEAQRARAFYPSEVGGDDTIRGSAARHVDDHEDPARQSRHL